VLVTAKELLSQQWLLPAGYRREKTSSLGRSDAIIISKCGDVVEYEMARTRLLTRRPDVIAGCRLVPTSLTNAASGESLDREIASRSPALVFAGLGDPASFVKSAQDFGCMVARRVFYRDHHWYTAGDLSRLRIETDQNNLRFMVTTRKDLARIRSLGTAGEEFLQRGNVYVLDVDTAFIDGEDAIDRLIDEAVN
jgi:tetraacyldisaccharide 4'-kinase